MARSPYPPRKQYRRTFIKEWRKHRGLSQETLAAEAGIQPSALSYLERGQSGYTQATLEALALVLQTTPAALLNVDPSKDSEVADLMAVIDDNNRDQIMRVVRALVSPKH